MELETLARWFVAENPTRPVELFSDARDFQTGRDDIPQHMHYCDFLVAAIENLYKQS